LHLFEKKIISFSHLQSNPDSGATQHLPKSPYRPSHKYTEHLWGFYVSSHGRSELVQRLVQFNGSRELGFKIVADDGSRDRFRNSTSLTNKNLVFAACTAKHKIDIFASFSHRCHHIFDTTHKKQAIFLHVSLSISVFRKEANRTCPVDIANI
jgi:hypothetical protein